MKTGDIRVITQERYREETVMILKDSSGIYGTGYFHTTYKDGDVPNQVFREDQTREATPEEISEFYKSHPKFNPKEINYEIY